MKIRVEIKVKTNSDADSVVDLVVSPGETVSSVKDKLATTQLIPFPEQELSLNGKILTNDAKVAACGIQDGCLLRFDVNSSEATLAQQLAELLKARDLSPDELGLLYCYKSGVSVNQALKLLGFDGKLKDFVAKQKTLSVENGSVAIVRKEAAMKPFSVVDEVVHLLKASSTGTMDIKDLSAKFVQKFGVSLSSIVGSRPGDFLAKEKTFVLHGKGMVSLQGTKKVKPVEDVRKVASVAHLIPTPQPTSDIAAPPGLDCSSNTAPEESLELDAQQYLDLHGKICSRPFNSKITQVLNDLVSAISAETFLDIDHAVTGGNIGKGTAIMGCATAEVVLFLRGLPVTGQESWVSPLLKALAGTLSGDFQKTHMLESVQIAEESVQIRTRGPIPMTIDIYLSPTFENYAHTLQVLGEQNLDIRKFYTPSLAKERTQFVARQPSSVKVTMRLVKWWRDQQEWTGRLARPSDELLELSTIYSAIQTKPADQKVAIANVMSLLSRFDQMRVVWSNYYSKGDVWKPLLQQRPLLMDPTNPSVNVADPQAFDPSELMSLARTTHFFW